MSEVPSYATASPSGMYTRTSGKAIASMVLGIVFCIPVVTSLLAVLFGVGGIRATRDPGVRGRGMAMAGLVMGICGMLFWGAMGAFVVFLIMASRAPRAVVNDFAADMGKNDLPAAKTLCDPTVFTATGLAGLRTYVEPFGSYVDQTCMGVNLQPGSCQLSGTLHFLHGDHTYRAILHKSGSDGKIWSIRII